MSEKVHTGRTIGWLFLLLLFAACGVKRPEGVLSDVQMQAVLYDYHVAKAMGEELNYDENFKKMLYVESVFQKHGITRQQFDSSMAWYARNAEDMAKLYEQITPRLKRERDAVNHLIALRDNKPRESLSGDSVDVWSYDARYRLTGNPRHNLLSFNFRTDTCFHATDSLEWSCKVRFYGKLPTKAEQPVMALQLVYDNDSVCSSSCSPGQNGMARVAIANDTLGSLREVRGFIYYPLPAHSGNAVFIDHISLMRYHRAVPDSVRNKAKRVEEKKSTGKNTDEVGKTNSPLRMPVTDRHHRPTTPLRKSQQTDRTPEKGDIKAPMPRKVTNPSTTERANTPLKVQPIKRFL